MKLHPDKENALLDWINQLNVDVPVRTIKDLQDGVVLMKLVYRLRNEEPPKSCLDLPLQERLKVVSDFLQGRNRCRTGQGTIISWDNINNGVNLEVELSKVVVLLLYHSEINSHVDLNRLEFKFEVELASMLRFVLENEGSLYLSENLEKYLRKKPLLSFTSDVSSSPTTSTTSSSVNMFSDSESPVIRRKKGSRSVQFLDLTTVASSSVSSPLQEVINTPQFQLKKLQNQLRQERDLRDELEKDLASTSTDLEQRESQICQLQFRIEKLLREKAEQEQEPRDELQELLDKNECLRSRLHEVLKQCQELKNNSCQMERKVDDLTEENGTLASQMREAIARLASANAEVERLTEAQDLAKGEWCSRHSYLQAELSQATAQKEFLTEQMLILQSKISSLEDELQKALTQERGEVMGPIMECEQLREYECTIARLEGEKEQSAALMQSLAQENQHNMEELREQLRLAMEQFQDVQEKNKAITTHLWEKEDALSQKEMTINGLEKQLQAMTSLASQRHQETLALQEELSLLKKEVNLLQEEVERRRAAEALAAEGAREKDRKVVELEMSVSDLRQQLGSVVQCVDAKSQDCERLETEVERREAQLQELSRQESSMREEATLLRREVSTNVRNLEEAQKEKEALKVELATQQNELREEVSRHQNRAAELQQSKEEQEAVIRMLNQQEEIAREEAALKLEAIQAQMQEVSSLAAAKDLQLHILREEATQLRQEISSYVSHLEQVQKENVELKEQKERAGEEANLKMEALQAQIKEVSSLTAGKDLQLCSLREEATGLQGKLAKQEQDIYHHKELLQEAHREKASVEALREELIRQQEELRRELISQQEKAAVLQKSLKAEQEALGELTVKEASAREEATQLCREIASHVIHLQQVQQENEELKEQAQRTRVEANLKVEALQAQMKEVSSLAAAKEVQLSSLREEATGLQGKLAEQKQDIFHHKELLQEAHREKESVEVLREELIKQQEELSGEFTIQQQKVANLQNSLKEEQEALRALTVNEVRAKEEVTRLCLEISTHVSHLDEMQKEKEALQDQGERAREEAYLKIEVLQTQMENVSSLAAAKELQLSTLRDESVLLRQENTKQAADLEVLQREKVQLEGLLSEEHTALNEQLAKQQVELRGEVSLHQQKAIELQQSVEEKEEALRVLKEQLVKQQGDCSLKKEVLQVSQAAVVQEKEAGDALRLELSLHQQRATELQKSLDEKEDALKEQEERARGEATRLSQEISTHVGNLQQVQQQKEELQMQKESARVEATLKMEALQARITEMSSLVAMKDQHLFNLREEANALQVKLAEQEQDISHHKELVQEAHREKESVRTLQKELTRQQEELREELIIQQEKAAELKQNMEDEQEALRKLTVKEASARVEATQLCQEISTHVSNLEQVRKEQEGLKEQKERAREEASLKIEALQAQMTEMSSLVAAKDQQLCNLREESILVRQENTKHAAHLEVLQREKVQLEGLLSEEHTALNEQLAKQQVELRGEVSFHQQKATELQQSVEEKEEALRVLKEQLVKQQGDCSLQKEVLQVAQAAVVQEKEAGDALRLELSLHQQRATELQNSLDEKEDALKEQEERAREEAIRFSQEISTHVGNLQQVQQQKEELQMQKESARAEATLKMEALQAQITEMSSLVAMKDQQLCTLGEEANALQGKLAEQEQDISHHKELLKESHREEESVETLQKELAKQQEELRREVSLHQLKTTELQQSVEEKEAALKELRKQENMQIEAVRLHQEISTRLEQVQKEGELKEREGRTREEVLHAQVEQMSSLAATKDLQLCSLKEEAILLRQEISMHVSHLEEVKTLKMESEGLLRKENTVLLEQLVKQKVEKGVLLEAESVAALGREKLDRQKEELMEELSVLQQEKNALVSQVLQAKQIQNELEGSVAELQAQRESSQREQRTQLDALILEKQRLLENNKVLERECGAKRLEAVLQEEQALMQEGMDGAKELERRNNELQEQLKAKTEAVEHYKAQMEKARSHYVGKKQQLVKVQEELTELQRVVEVKEHAVSAVNAEMKLLQKELDKARSTENALSTKVNTLKAQLAFAERHLRDNVSLRPENASGRTEKVQSQARQEISGDSLDLSLNDSLNTTTRPSQPEESSTPLVRSSGRLAAKRKSTEREGSLETLYFTPMNTRQINRTSTERRLESSITSLGELALDSAQRRPPTSSVKRRRTTQVINITMSKARGDDANETFYEMSSVRSNPDILGTHNTRPSSMEVSQTPGKGIPTSSDQLLNLPGYRRSTIHAAPPRSTSQFCVGTENEPEQAGDDWMRIAELQSRNQACLPHLKSSYPLESRPSLGPSFSITDDDLRTGDPSETIRRASMMPDQIQESLQSHRMSLHLGQVDSTGFSGPAYGSHRLSLMPQKASSNLSHQNTHALRASTLKRSAKDQRPNTPERGVTSCFPRPLTPKGGRFGSSNTQNRQIQSPAERRQSMAFSIDNTPQKAAAKSGFILRGMNKIRNSARKSPGHVSQTRVPRSGAAKSPRSTTGSVKSPGQGGKAQRRSPRTNNSKSPKVPTSTRKMMSFKMKV